jgi:hypothetical protein
MIAWRLRLHLPSAHLYQEVTYDPEACLFFARAPQDVTQEEILALFSQYGTVEDDSIYRSWCVQRTAMLFSQQFVKTHSNMPLQSINLWLTDNILAACASPLQC